MIIQDGDGMATKEKKVYRMATVAKAPGKFEACSPLEATTEARRKCQSVFYLTDCRNCLPSALNVLGEREPMLAALIKQSYNTMHNGH